MIQIIIQFDKNNIVYSIECWFMIYYDLWLLTLFSFYFCFFLFGFSFFIYFYIFFWVWEFGIPNLRIPNSVTNLNFGLFYPLIATSLV